MIVRVPDYFSEFSCIAGDCKDSCCLAGKLILMRIHMSIIRHCPERSESV